MAFVISFDDEEKNERATKRMSQKANEREKKRGSSENGGTRWQERQMKRKKERERGEGGEQAIALSYWTRGSGWDPTVWSYAPYRKKKQKTAKVYFTSRSVSRCVSRAIEKFIQRITRHVGCSSLGPLSIYGSHTEWYEMLAHMLPCTCDEVACYCILDETASTSPLLYIERK